MCRALPGSCGEAFKGSGLRAQGSRLRAQGSGLRAQRSGLRAQGSKRAFFFGQCWLKCFMYSRATWCSGITCASHAEGPGFNPQCVHFSDRQKLRAEGIKSHLFEVFQAGKAQKRCDFLCRALPGSCGEAFKGSGLRGLRA